MRKFISVRTSAGDVPAYLSLPERPNGRAVVLAMSVWGINHDLQGWADYLASFGYAVLAPNLFWRSDPDHAIDYDFGRFGRVAELMDAETDEGGVLVLEECGAELKRMTGAGALAIVGWCYGGRLACLCGLGSSFEAIVAFYPTTLETRLDIVGRLNAPISLHLPEIEQFGTVEDAIERIVEAFRNQPGAEVFVYPGAKHGFEFGPPHPNFDRIAARLADTRAVLFLQRALTRRAA